MALFSLLSDDAGILLRWLHVVAAMVWVGSAFALARLDLGMRPPRLEGAPQSLLLHAGAGFRFARADKAEEAERALHFKWEAYAAWASGLALLCLVFCAAPELYLIDPQVWGAPGWAAVAVALGLLPAVWLAYDAMCGRSGLAGDRLLIALYVLAAALALALCHLFSGRAAWLLLGANLATLMTANIAHVIAPVQRRRLASLRAGLAADAADAKAAATRALHNQYLALPVVFFMLSGHAPLLFAGPHRDLAAASFLAAGFLVRRLFLKKARNLGWDWSLTAAACAFAALGFALSTPLEPQGEASAESASEAIALAVRPGIEDARAILERNCAACHAAAPSYPGLAHAAAGLDFSDRQTIDRFSGQILRAAVFSRAMPPPGAAPSLDADDRRTLLRWAKMR